MNTLTTHERQLIEDKLQEAKDLFDQSLKEDNVVFDPNSTKEEVEDALRKIDKYSKDIRGIMEQREAIIQRAFDELTK